MGVARLGVASSAADLAEELTLRADEPPHERPSRQGGALRGEEGPPGTLPVAPRFHSISVTPLAA